MSWKRALDTIDTRIGLHLDTEKGSLRHWTMVIGKTYAYYQENFLGHAYHSFGSLVIAMDGRSEGSQFPNFLVHKERERWGV